MIGIVLTVLRFAWPFLLLGIAYFWADVEWCNHACRVQKANVASEHAQVLKLNDAIASAQKRATDLALLWSKQVDKSDQELRKQQENDRAIVDALQARIKRLSDRPTIVISSDAGRLLDDASRFANQTPAAPEVHQDAAAPVPSVSEQALAQAWADAAAAYRDAYGHWQACVNFYEKLNEP